MKEQVDTPFSGLRSGLRSAIGRLFHDVRSPLNAVSGYSQLVRDGFAGPVNEEQAKLLDRVSAAVREMVEASNAAELEAEEILRDFPATVSSREDPSETLLSMLLEHLPVLVWSTDVDSRITVVLGETLLETGLTAEAVVGNRVEDMAALCEHGDDAVRAHSSAIAGQAANFEWRIGARTLTATVVPRRDLSGAVVGSMGVGLDVTPRRWLAEQARTLAREDPLTELPNRPEAVERVGLAIARPRTDGSTVAVLALSLESFYRVGASFGHAFSDRLLRLFAQRLRDWVGSDGFIARIAEDTFLVVLTEIAGAGEIMTRARSLASECGHQFFIDGQSVSVTANTGISVFPDGGGSSEELVANAEAAAPRNHGVDRVRFYTRALQDAATSQLVLAGDLAEVLERDELFLEYQPVVDAAGTTILGAEALLRWRHPSRGVVSPAEFISLAEETGAIGPIGDWVLRSACTQAAKWPLGSHVSVNVSPLQLVDSLPDRIGEVLRETGLEPSRLQLEMTESTIVGDRARANGLLHRLRRTGVQLALDDFGTGFSSLAHLRNFELDVLKIDKAFVHAVGEDLRDQAVVRAVVALGASLGMRIIAEGVETSRQVRVLRQLGCEAMQGFYFSRPVSPERLERMFHSGHVSARAARRAAI